MPSNNFLEFLNLFLAIQGVIAVVVFSRYLLDQWPYWTNKPSTRLAMGFITFFSGFSFLRFWTWLIRFAEEQGFYVPPHHGTWSYQVRPLFVIGALVMTAGMICMMREISVWKNNAGWISVMLLSAVVAAIVAWGL